MPDVENILPKGMFKFLTKLFAMLYKPHGLVTSNYHQDIHIGRSYGSQTLFTGKTSQSGGEYLPMWKEVVKAVKHSNPHARSFLILGVAGGTVITALREVYPDSVITGIEIDPQMILTGNSAFGLSSIPRFTEINADAFTWLKRNRTTYDVIISDLYINDLNPVESHSTTFLITLKQHLKERGVILFNSDYSVKKIKLFTDFEKLCTVHFSGVLIIFKFPKNRILLLEP